jgi:hypothetical protein
MLACGTYLATKASYGSAAQLVVIVSSCKRKKKVASPSFRRYRAHPLPRPNKLAHEVARWFFFFFLSFSFSFFIWCENTK